MNDKIVYIVGFDIPELAAKVNALTQRPPTGDMDDSAWVPHGSLAYGDGKWVQCMVIKVFG